MAKPGRATQAKRNRELAKQDKQKDKAERRAIRKEQKSNGIPRSLDPSEDPDLVGIIPGPQKPLEE